MKHQLTLLLAICHVINQFPSVTTAGVTCNKVCNCSSNDEFNEILITCSGVEILIFHRYIREDITIKCQQPHDELSTIFTDLNISPNRYGLVEIHRCTLPNSSLSDLLGSIGVTDFPKLVIISYSGSLQSKHFEKLDKVDYLKVAQSDLGVLPVDTFASLTNLKSLEIVLSSFKLENDMFRCNKKLEMISLVTNNVSEISFDVFNNISSLWLITITGVRNTSLVFNHSKQYVVPALTELQLESVSLKNKQVHMLGSVDGQGEIPSPERTTTGLPIQLREIILQGTKIFKIVLKDNTKNDILLQSRYFADLPNLFEVQIVANNLKFVPEDAFSKSTNIHWLDLNSNLIDTFQENTFSDLENLELLNVSFNRITYLPEGLFSNKKQLRWLDVSYNLLKHIEPNLLSNLTKLISLDLSYNNIIFISGEQFFQLHNVESIDLSHNQLISLALDPLLRDLDYSMFFNCKKLDRLLLQHNYLKEIYEDWFSWGNNRINLANNNITDLQIFMFTYDKIAAAEKNLEKIKPVNKFEYLSLMINLYGKYISNNTINCDCDLLALLNDPYKNLTNDIEKIGFSQVKCREPKVFQEKDLNWTAEFEKCKELPLDENQKFHQGCPKGCICVYRPLTKSSVINCQNAGLQNYPRTLPVAPGADHTELTLYGNRLQEFSLPDDPGYKNVTFLNLANNLLSTLDINGVSKKLKKLDLSHNQLKTLSVETLELLEEALELERLELQNNTWLCDFSNYRLAQVVYDKRRLIWHKVTCTDGSPVVNIIALFESNLRQIITYIMLILLMIVFILTVLYYRHRQKVHIYCFSSRWKVLRWLVSHPDCNDDDKLYDAFIIYSQEDEMFVVNHLVPYLEETEDRKYKLCLHVRDWIPGEQILIQIGRSVRSSRRAIVVLSPNFLRSVWGVAEFRVAHAEALKDGKARVIVILYQDVSDDEVDEELKAYLQTNTYVRWGSPWFWKQLTYALPHPPDRERAALHYFTRGRRFQDSLDVAERHE